MVTVTTATAETDVALKEVVEHLDVAKVRIFFVRKLVTPRPGPQDRVNCYPFDVSLTSLISLLFCCAMYCTGNQQR